MLDIVPGQTKRFLNVSYCYVHKNDPPKSSIWIPVFICRLNLFDVSCIHYSSIVYSTDIES